MNSETFLPKVKVIVGVMIVVALGTYSYFTFKQSEYLYGGPMTISVVGKGEVFAKPDIATFSFTVEAKEADAVTAQNKSAATMDAIVAFLKEKGVEDKDIKTSYYNLDPRYEYPQSVCTQWNCPPAGEPKLIGYDVSQSVSVKVRDTQKAGELVSGVGSKGAQNVSGLSFTIDDIEKINAEARDKAIVDAKEQAKVLAGDLGMHLGKMTGFWEDQGGPTPYYDKGGAQMIKSAVSAPEMSNPAQIPTGENTVTSNVNLTYEIK